MQPLVLTRGRAAGAQFSSASKIQFVYGIHFGYILPIWLFLVRLITFLQFQIRLKLFSLNINFYLISATNFKNTVLHHENERY